MQAEKIISNQEALEKIGFEIKMSGDNQWSIFAAPKFLKNEDLIPFVNDLIQDLGSESGRLDTVERKKDYVAFMKSCKGAVNKSETYFTEMKITRGHTKGFQIHGLVFTAGNRNADITPQHR